MMIGKISTFVCSVAIVCAGSSGLHAASASYQGVGPWGASDVAAGYPGAFDVTASGKILALSGLAVNELSAVGAFERAVGAVPDFDNGPEYASFLRLSPDASQVWVGFTTTGNASDRVYSLPFAGGSATHEATLAGNYDLEFAKVSGVYRPFASGATGFASPNNSIYLLDTTGGAHTKVAELGGYGTGFAFDAAGNLYAMNQTAQKLYRFAAADVETAALGLTGFLTPDNADFSTDTAFAGSDITVDGAGNVFFNANDPTFGGQVMVGRLDPSAAGAYKYDVIATGIAGFNWTTQMDFGGGTGDATLGEGALYVNDYYGNGNLSVLEVPEPATLALGTLAMAGFVLVRRRVAAK